jgi:hypothetical protein
MFCPNNVITRLAGIAIVSAVGQPYGCRHAGDTASHSGSGWSCNSLATIRSVIALDLPRVRQPALNDLALVGATDQEEVQQRRPLVVEDIIALLWLAYFWVRSAK